MWRCLAELDSSYESYGLTSLPDYVNRFQRDHVADHCFVIMSCPVFVTFLTHPHWIDQSEAAHSKQRQSATYQLCWFYSTPSISSSNIWFMLGIAGNRLTGSWLCRYLTKIRWSEQCIWPGTLTAGWSDPGLFPISWGLSSMESIWTNQYHGTTEGFEDFSHLLESWGILQSSSFFHWHALESHEPWKKFPRWIVTTMSSWTMLSKGDYLQMT